MFSFYWSHVTILISQGALPSWNSQIEPCWVDCWCLWGLFCKVCAILEGCNGFGKVSIHSGRVSIHSGRVSIHSGRVIIQSGKVSIHGSVKTKEIGYVWHLHLHAIVTNISLCLSWFLIFCQCSQYLVKVPEIIPWFYWTFAKIKSSSVPTCAAWVPAWSWHQSNMGTNSWIMLNIASI